MPNFSANPFTHAIVEFSAPATTTRRLLSLSGVTFELRLNSRSMLDVPNMMVALCLATALATPRDIGKVGMTDERQPLYISGE
ncbi:hypothetical protein DK37_07200 [Halomonas sp. SUBG004]|nr:hypothetical protein DK37_07200 [Halomonas sp. SUBG004]